MSILIVATIFIWTIIVIYFLQTSNYRKLKHYHMNKILIHFSKLGTLYNLSFSSQEILGNVIIGLDGIHRKILILEVSDAIMNNYVIDLTEVKHCTVKKYYGNIKPGGLKNNKMESFLEKICLHFEFHEEKESKEVVFYNHNANQLYELSVLEQKAIHWKEILEKMLVVGKPRLQDAVGQGNPLRA